MAEQLATSTPISSRLDPDRHPWVSIFGKKGSGKSVLARRLWDSWSGDALCIDVTRDALAPEDVQQTFRGEVPDGWPMPARDDEPVRIRYVPDMRSATYTDDVDRAVGLAARNRGCLLWIDEIGIVAPVNKTRGHLRHFLHQGRHDRTTALMCGPRPVTIDPMVIAQSDFVYVFELPNPADRRRVADVCGIAPALLDDAVHALEKGGHEYLRWDGVELVQFPPLPLARTRKPPPPAG